MKLLQINAVYGIGSTGKIVQDIDKLAQKNGIDSYVAYSMASSKPKQGFLIGHPFEKKMHAFFSRIGGRQGYYSFFATRELIRYIKRLSPDIVHLHNLHSNYVNLKMLLSFLAESDCKVVITQHDCWYFTGKCFHYAYSGCSRWKEGCGSCPQRRSGTPAYLWDCSAAVLSDKKELYVRMRNLTVVSVSQWLTAETQQSILSQKDLLTIYNGIDLGIYCPTHSDFRCAYGIKDKYVIVGMANKWLAPCNKDAFAEIMSKMDEHCVLVLVGCSEQQIRQQTEKVIKIGYVRDQKKLAELYSMADVFVNLTHEDSLPTVNLEAQACGTPVITNAVTGATETVLSGKTGYAVLNGDIQACWKAIELLRSNGKDRYSEACRDFIKKSFEKQMNYQKYISLYKSLVKGVGDEDGFK